MARNIKNNPDAPAKPEIRDYPTAPSSRPHVIIVGAGVAGMAAAHRLLERGHDVTLLEANSFLGGKLGAHQQADEMHQVRTELDILGLGIGSAIRQATEAAASRRFGQGKCTPCTEPCCKALRKDDWHEHCYHMYLNWYHNFWQLMRDIGTIDRFEPMTEINYLNPDPEADPIKAVNSGSLATAVQNMTCGVASPADVFLHSQALRDLIATPEHHDRRLDQLSVEAFLREHPYTTASSRKASHRVLAKAFASPTAMASASSYKSFLKYGARLPEPSMWLLNGHTEEAIFTPWLRKLIHLAGKSELDWPWPKKRPVFDALLKEVRKTKRSKAEREALPIFTLKPLTRLSGIEVDPETGDFLLRIERQDYSPSVQPELTPGSSGRSADLWRFAGQVVMTVPPRQLARLVHNRADNRDAYYQRTLAGADPSLANVARLKGAPIMTLDIVLKEPLKRPVPRGIVLLLDAEYELSVYDNSQMWRSEDATGPGLTHLSICASDADTLMPFVEQQGGAQLIIWLILQELRRFIDFDPAADILHCRTHLQTNAGSELFINAVNTWHYRPRTTTAIPDLFIAGDFVQTPIDVVTIEGAAMSGLMAAEAVRRRTGVGRAVPIVVPDAMPGAVAKLAAETLRPIAYAAKAMSDTDTAMSKAFKGLFPDE